MFDIGWSELVLIGAVALVVIGPKELPGMLRTVGGAVTKIRRMAAEFQGQISEAIREAELDDAKKTVDGLNQTVSAGFNPIQTIRDEIRNAVEGTNPAATPAIPPSDPVIPLPEQPPVPDLTSEQIAAAFAPSPPVETAAETPAEEPVKRKRTRKVATATESEVAAPVSSTDMTDVAPEAPKPRRRVSRKSAEQAPAPAARDDEGTAG